jgi:uncharacterized NAD(P)/FAD-binding protein YdhS
MRRVAPRIAVVGGGASGALAAIRLLRAADGPLEIILLDPKGNWGRGVAYGTEWPGHLLNVPAGRMSALPEEPSHFLDWLRGEGPGARPARLPKADAATFAPRVLYGEYLGELLDESVRRRGPGTWLRLRREQVIAIRDRGRQAMVVSREARAGNRAPELEPLGVERRIFADRVVLALGHLAAKLPRGFPPGHPSCVTDAWAPAALDRVAPDRPVLLVGSGLTMADVVLRLADRGVSGPFLALSRHGLLPLPHAENPLAPPAALDLSPGTLRWLARQVHHAVNGVERTGGDWRRVVDALRPHTPGLWSGLGLEEQRRFQRHLRSYWERARHRVPAEVGRALAGLVSTGRLRPLAGRLESVTPTEGGLTAVIRDRHGNRETHAVGTLVNCAGTDDNYRRIEDPLVRQLLADGLVQPHPAGPGLRTSETGALVDAAGKPSAWLYTLGPPRRGDRWETTAMPEIRVQAAELAARILADRTRRPSHEEILR